MEITSRQEGAVSIIEVAGRMDAVTAPTFDKFFREISSSEIQAFLILMNNLDYISSAGLRSILMAAKQVKAKNGRLVLAGMKDAVKEVFNLSGFQAILRICESGEDALKELQ
jgi:anti-anti-sigma factor